MHVTELSFSDFEEQFSRDEGLALLGTGGNLQEWIDGISQTLYELGITNTADPDKLWSGAVRLTTLRGRYDLLLTFPVKGYLYIDLPKMALWRLQVSGCSWISDYRRNFRKDHILEELQETQCLGDW